MEDLVCSKKECNNIPEYFNREEDDFYCEECAYSYFDENEFEKIGSVKIIKQMIELSKHLLDKLQDYANKEQLAIKWKKELSQYLTFYDELKLITNELKDTEENKTQANLFLIQQRSTNLKFQITRSKAYQKYLLHKDISEFRPKCAHTNIASKTTQIDKNSVINKCEEEIKVAKDDPSNCQSDLKIEDTEKKYEEKKTTTEIQGLKEEDQEKYEEENIFYEETKLEIEDDLNKPKNILEQSDASNSISYEAFENLLIQHIGDCSMSCVQGVTFDLTNDKCKKMLQILSEYSLPQFEYLNLSYIPFNCEEANLFMLKSFPNVESFTFNNNANMEIDASYYLDGLKAAACKVTDAFFVDMTKFTSKEFCEILTSAKRAKKLNFQYSTIPLDEEVDFGDMEGSNIEFINLFGSGKACYSNWEAFPLRFENLIASITKSKGLYKSLKTIFVGNTTIITKAKVQEIQDKYNLNDVIFDGVY